MESMITDNDRAFFDEGYQLLNGFNCRGREKLFSRFFIDPSRNVLNHENLTLEERLYRSLAFRLGIQALCSSFVLHCKSDRASILISMPIEASR